MNETFYNCCPCHIKHICILFCTVCKKPPGNIYFSRFDRKLTEIRPLVECDIKFKKGEVIYIYIYSTKKFKYDRLTILFAHLDNKGVYYPKSEIARNLDIDVNPNGQAAKSKIVMHKSGQYFIKIFNKPKDYYPKRPFKPIRPLALGELWIE